MAGAAKHAAAMAMYFESWTIVDLKVVRLELSGFQDYHGSLYLYMIAVFSHLLLAACRPGSTRNFWTGAIV